MTSDTTPHTFQQEHYSKMSKMEGNILPIVMMAFGFAGILVFLFNFG